MCAAREYPDSARVGGTPLLSSPLWLPHEPIPLDRIKLQYTHAVEFDGITGTEPIVQRLLPTRADGTRYRTYSDAVEALAAPAIFKNRSTYRLLRADLQSNPYMIFSSGHYFDGIDIGDAVAHEFTSATLSEVETQDLRTAIGEPYNPARRLMNAAISTLTLRYDWAAGAVTFPLHHRDGARVGHAGGMYQVLPVGVFQPAGEEPWNTTNDFSLWRCVIREFAEELRGDAEHYDTHRGPIDYDTWPFAHQLTRALDTSQVHAYCLGIGIDPLTFATDILTVVTIDAPLYDELFDEIADANAEGSITPAVPFTAQTVQRYASVEPMQAAGAGLLRLAWRHRSTLLA